MDELYGANRDKVYPDGCLGLRLTNIDGKTCKAIKEESTPVRHCSLCDRVLIGDWSYCPHCGARIVGDE